MRWLRDLYLILAAPLMRVVFEIGGLFNAKLRKGVELRKPVGKQARWLVGTPTLQPFWFHCASGEFEYAKPVIRLLKEQMPDVPILVTYFSSSAQNSIEKFAGVDIAVASPWENSANWRDFLNFYSPRALLIARTDAWPEMVYQAEQKKIPSLLFSATLVKDSSRMRFPARYFTQMSFSRLTQIFCVSEDDARLFSELGFANKTRVAGDTRYDQVLARLEDTRQKNILTLDGANVLRKLKPEFESRRLFVAGSTWSADEIELVKTIAQTKSRIKFVIVPHEPTASHLSALQARLSELKISNKLFSELSTGDQNATDVVIVDRVGILADLYLAADFAFVGGSFRKTVHSVMEPLAAGCLTFVGPLHLNNREAIEFQTLPIGLVTPVQSVIDGRDLQQKLNLLLDLPADEFEDLKSKVTDEVRKRAGRSELVVKWIQGNV